MASQTHFSNSQLLKVILEWTNQAYCVSREEAQKILWRTYASNTQAFLSQVQRPLRIVDANNKAPTLTLLGLSANS